MFVIMSTDTDSTPGVCTGHANLQFGSFIEKIDRKKRDLHQRSCHFSLLDFLHKLMKQNAEGD